MHLDYGEYQNLIEEKKQLLLKAARKCLKKKQLKVVHLAIEVASHAHYGQYRKSGEPYISHPLEVAAIIAEWGIDEHTIAGAILHDVIEDTTVTKADISQMFGPNIAKLVDSVTKLEKLNFESEEVAHAEYFRKVVLAMAKDIRVILIKLADRLHNVLTLHSMKPEKRQKIALETMEIYVPIANRIGLNKVYLQLADESFRYLNPFRYRILSAALNNAQEKRLPLIQEILRNIGDSLKSNGINASFTYRQRAIFNLYQRMRKEHQSFEQIYDIFAIKVVVSTIPECYLAMGSLHSLYQPLPGKFKDHIAIPKSNGYQSLHSTLMGPHGIPIKLQIRTNLMDQVAENGIIFHWLKHQDKEELIHTNQRTTNWINNILDIQSSSFSANDFLKNIKQDLSPGDIYAFTPKGKIILLPRGSTPLDFAYFIHSDIGNHCYKARVNQKSSKLNTVLQSGDIVEIITSDEIEPDSTWLSMVASSKAISKIKHFLKEQRSEEGLNKGVALLSLILKMLESPIKVDEIALTDVCKKYYPSLNYQELEHQISIGNISALEVAKQIMGYTKLTPINIKLSKCPLKILQDKTCSPLPGQSLLVQLTHNNELILHLANCKQIKNLELDNLTLVHIINDTDRTFSARIEGFLLNRAGVFTEFAAKFSEKGINIDELSQEFFTDKYALIQATIGLKSINQAESLIDMLKKTDFVTRIKII